MPPRAVLLGQLRQLGMVTLLRLPFPPLGLGPLGEQATCPATGDAPLICHMSPLPAGMGVPSPDGANGPT
jgi:hypothetical protein